MRRDGDRGAWLSFFLEGVRVTVDGVISTAERLLAMFGADRRPQASTAICRR
jgi:hypothetical protein